MTAYFIFNKDGSLFDYVPYNSESDAIDKIVNMDSIRSKLEPESLCIIGKDSITSEQLNTGYWYYSSSDDMWLFNEYYWYLNYLLPYVKNNFIIEQKEYDIVFKN